MLDEKGAAPVVVHVEIEAPDRSVPVADLPERSVPVAELNDVILRLGERLAASQHQFETLAERFAAVSAERADARSTIAALEDGLAHKAQVTAALTRTLEAARGELRNSEQQRIASAIRQRQLEGEVATVAQRLQQAKAATEVAERNAAAAGGERDKMRARVQELEKRLATASLSPQRPGAATTVAMASDGGAGPSWSEVERVLSGAGIDVRRWLAEHGAAAPSQGGPYVGLGDLARRPVAGPEEVLAGIKGENLQRALRNLPVAAPLDNYQLESRFGARSDPFNRRASFHTGLDFGAPYRSPVMATGPGRVTFAGPKGEYGKVVEIDHGYGIVTRYAHLHRTSVAVGERVSSRTQIGLLGSTGRSTGPHVHYEVMVNGTPQDPEKFLRIGRSPILTAAARN